MATNRFAQQERQQQLVPQPQPGDGPPYRVADVLAELLAQYEVRFPELNVVVVETPAVQGCWAQ